MTQLQTAKRRFLAGVLASFAPLFGVRAWAQKSPTPRLRPKNPPVWTSFGLNGSPNHPRFSLTKEFVEGVRPEGLGMRVIDSEAFGFMRERVTPLLMRQQPPTVQMKDSIAFKEDLILGFAHDFEIAVGARMEKNGDNLNTLVIFMSGVGLILTFEPDIGWRVISSFPFKLRLERFGKDLKNVRQLALENFDDCYSEYGKAFAEFVSRFNKWDQGFASNIFARLTKVEFHKDSKEKLSGFKLDEKFDEEFVGFLSSTYICDSLNIPLLPFREATDAMARFGTKYKEVMKVQGVNQKGMPPADFRFEIVIRDLSKTLTPSRQLGITVIRRKLVINFLAVFMDDNNEPEKILQTFAISEGEDKIPYGTIEDDTPDRDLIFFERLLSSILSNLLSGIAKRDAQLLARVGVKLDFLAPSIPRFLDCCSKVR
jgi:hypothetical protein